MKAYIQIQTIALYIGIPVFLSQTMVVSRWLVIPIETMLLLFTLPLRIASLHTNITEFQIHYIDFSGL